jgi:hypothetical protein
VAAKGAREERVLGGVVVGRGGDGRISGRR